jgi:hypothetical protein
MFKKLLDDVIRWMYKHEESTDTPSKLHQFEVGLRRQLLTNDLKEIVEDLRHANTLAKLLEMRKRIQEFQQNVIESNEYTWGKQHILDLYKVWKIKYHQWKKY